MRVELRTRDGETLGHLELKVAPEVAQQALMHTQAVLGPTVTDASAVAPVLADEAGTTPKPKRRRKGQQA